MTLTENIKGKRARVKDRVTCLTNLCEWIAELGLGRIPEIQTLIREKKDRKKRGVFIANVLK